MTEQPVSPDITSDDKLWAALGYPIPLVPIIVLLMEEKKERPFIKFHAILHLHRGDFWFRCDLRTFALAGNPLASI
jgi:hypothetical protein